MKRIAVLTSGGDAPGMNAAVRAVVRTALAQDWEVFGVQHGYSGLLGGDFRPLRHRDVGGIMQRGGTMLGSARCAEMKTEEGQIEAVRQLRERDVDALVVIGGNGSQQGAHALTELGFPVVGIASTIDNDLPGSDITIGVDTALNIALEAIDRLKVTASSHQRAFLVETMGRHCGYIALMTGIAGGAEAIVLPEVETDPEVIAEDIRQAYQRGKAHAIVVVAEGAKYNAEGLVSYFQTHRERLGFDLRATKLGHVQRGGAPGVFDRMLATRLGAGAIDALVCGETGVLVGWLHGHVATTQLSEVIAQEKLLDLSLLDLARVLAQ